MSHFGSSIEFAEPSWYRGVPSPYYNESHAAFRNKVRSFVERELIPHVSDWEENQDTLPIKELTKKMVQEGIYGCAYPKELGGSQFEGYDGFHSLIFSDEMSRVGAGGVVAALTVGIGIGLGPIALHAEKKPHFAEVCRKVLQAEKFICLAITEPQAGSDVSGIRTTATLDPSGKFYTVTGEKKFITGAHYADYFTTAVQTEHGVSVMLIERSSRVQVRRLRTQGWQTSHTGYVVLDAVQVPVENVVGEEGQGFKVIMHNFNGERLAMCTQSLRFSRLCLEQSVRYAMQRTTFQKPLWSSAVIRAKVAEMARRIESGMSWLESLVYAIREGARPGQVAGHIALLKVDTTQTFEYCAREASQIFGGASYLRSGPGEMVERLYREVRVQAIGGGSEEIMNDLAMRRLKAKL